VPLVIASAYGAERAEAVLAAVRGRFVDVLVADSPVALRILELEPP
jgi:DNA-binding transcriptional regulator LsrR (DeoR family)